ncbi:MAG TPA: KH domain-containing protein [Thermoanaerobaculia bacterium]|nr:KH domain-containing protein [Thermoanaerobaculia bacterium]
MKELVETVARALVTRPEEVAASESEEGGTLTVDLALSPEDLGRVIGREGRTARALRAFAAAAGRKRNQRVLVRIRG